VKKGTREERSFHHLERRREKKARQGEGIFAAAIGAPTTGYRGAVITPHARSAPAQQIREREREREREKKKKNNFAASSSSDRQQVSREI